MPGTRVTCQDIDTGFAESKVITDDYIVITDGNRYVANVQHYPKGGTTVLTIKTTTKKD